MKKIKYTYWVFSIFFLFLYSCTTSNLDTTKLLKSLVETSADGISATTFYTYNEDKIVSIDRNNKHIDFTYTAGLVTKIATLDKTNQSLSTVEYSYVDDLLVRVKSSNHYTINYIHNSDGTISYEKILTNAGSQSVKEFHGILYFQNKNLVKDERVFDNLDSGILSSYSLSYEYDTKINSLANILGYTKLLDHNETISSNNCRTIAVYTSTTINNQISSSANLYKRDYKYDSQGYPTEQAGENLTIINGSSYYKKSLYFYQ